MVIYLRHPKHGTKVAVSEEEAKSDEVNGWSRFNPAEKPEPAQSSQEKKKKQESVEI